MRELRADGTPALYHVSLKTGDVDGGDASGMYDDPELLGHLWLGAYLALEPELARVVEDDSGRVDDDNRRAIGFYRHLGFTEVDGYEGGIVFGRRF